MPRAPAGRTLTGRRKDTQVSRGKREMNAAAIVTFVVIAGAVWGGFLMILFVAVRKEQEKAQPAADGPPPG